jgi:KaiC/GvpD/RAD55 family RecA-like ATPase
MAKKNEVPRVPLYIKGLDNQMDGGVPKGHIVLMSGRAGSMKSSVSFNVIYNEAVKNKANCLYISLEQSYQSLIEHTENMGYDMSKTNLVIIDDLSKLKTTLTTIKKSNKGNIIFADLACIRKEIKDVSVSSNSGWLNVVKNLIKKIKLSVGLDVFVLDSMSALYVLSNFKNPRIELFYVFEFLRDAKVTSFLISEMSDDGKSYSEYGVEDYLADGIVHLELAKLRRNVIREISIVKMRSTKVNHDIFSLEYKNDKFEAKYGGQNPLV